MRGPDLKPRKKREGDKIKHGHSRRGRRSPEYAAWAHMISRCTNTKREDYPRYGGAGVTVCEPWRDSFAAFLAHIGERPSALHSVDRIDGRRGYEPGNVRWATPTEQSRNRRNVKRIEHDGQMLTAKEYCDATGLNYNTFKYRRDVLKWPFADAFSLRDGRKRQPPIE